MYSIHKAQRLHPSRASAGFTLIEIMIALAIVAILCTFAIPSYRSQVRLNAEEQAKQQILSVAVQLSNWRSKRLSYEGFIPQNKGCATGNNCYSIPATGVLYIPFGSDATSHNFAITIIDASPGAASISGKPLNDPAALGHGWRMLATPNANKDIVKDAKAFYSDSLGQRCQYDKGAFPTLTAVAIVCNGTGIGVW